ncbi:hypothetical protein C8R47DRAFT_1135262 [Mycena vitilis]|nr:hypothetical protein C8R47DRAFT_1135262 [Mycena vitilis]
MDVDTDMPPSNQGSNTVKRPRDAAEDASGPPTKRLTTIHISHAHGPPIQQPTTSAPVVDAWTQAIHACHIAQVKVPPARILEAYGDHRTETVKQFQDDLKRLQKAMGNLERFVQASDCSEVPVIVSNAIKVPHIQLLKGVPDLVGSDADVILAMGIAADAVDAARTVVIEYVCAIYTAQVVHCTEAVDISKCAGNLATALKGYSKEIIETTPNSGGDVSIWDACIDRLRTAVTVELTDLSFDFSAKLRTEALERDSKANAVATARAAAETSNAARPLEDLLKDHTRPYDKRIEDIEKQLSSATKSPTASSSKTPAKSSTTKAVGKKDKKKQKAAAKKSKEGQNAKHVDGDGKGTSKSEKKLKGKGKAEPQDSDSD